MSGTDQEIYQLTIEFLNRLIKTPQYSAFAKLPSKGTEYGKAFYSMFENPHSIFSIRQKMQKFAYNELRQIIDDLRDIVANFKSFYNKNSQAFEQLDNFDMQIDEFIQQNHLKSMLDNEARGKSHQFKRSQERHQAQKEERKEEKKNERKEKAAKKAAPSKRSKKNEIKSAPSIKRRQLQRAQQMKDKTQEMMMLIDSLDQMIQHEKMKEMKKIVNQEGKKVVHMKRVENQDVHRLDYSAMNDKQKMNFMKVNQKD